MGWRELINDRPVTMGLDEKQKRRSAFHSRRSTVYLFAILGVLYLLINNFIPILIGIVIAFKNVNFGLGILKSPWNGIDNFRYLFQTSDAWIITRNTLLYNMAFIAVGTVIAIIIALLLNEVKQRFLQKAFQGIILFPHLISMLIVSYLAYAFLSIENGFLNNSVLPILGIDPVSWYSEPKYWPFILVYISAWKNFGFLSLIFYAAIASIDQDMYEAARIDGATRFQQALRITLPLIKSTVMVMLLMHVGKIFYADFGLFYQVTLDSGALYGTTNVIDTYVYRALLKSGSIGMSAAACLYQSVVGFGVFCLANFVVRKVSPQDALF